MRKLLTLLVLMGLALPAFSQFKNATNGTALATVTAPNGNTYTIVDAGAGPKNVQLKNLWVGGASNAVSAASAIELVTTNRLARWVDPTNGLDSNPGTFAQPWKTLTNAVRTMTIPRSVIYAMPGQYNIGATNLNIPHGVSLIGYGAEIISSCDLDHGCVINPGSDSVVAGFTVICDTNTVYTRYAGSTHSGFWAAFGVYSSSPLDKSFTNVVARDLVFKNCSSDGFFFNSRGNNSSSISVYNCRVDSFWDCVVGDYSTTATNLVADFYNCYFRGRTTGALSDLTFDQNIGVSLQNGQMRFFNCSIQTEGFGTAVISSGAGSEYSKLSIFGGNIIPGQQALTINGDSEGVTSVNGSSYNLSPVIFANTSVSKWPAVPPLEGASALVMSNGFMYRLFSTNGAGGVSGTWTKTNYVGP